MVRQMTKLCLPQLAKEENIVVLIFAVKKPKNTVNSNLTNE